MLSEIQGYINSLPVVAGWISDTHLEVFLTSTGSGHFVSVVWDLHTSLSGSISLCDSLSKKLPSYRVDVFQGDHLSIGICNTITCILCDGLSYNLCASTS